MSRSVAHVLAVWAIFCLLAVNSQCPSGSSCCITSNPNLCSSGQTAGSCCDIQAGSTCCLGGNRDHHNNEHIFRNFVAHGNKKQNDRFDNTGGSPGGQGGLFLVLQGKRGKLCFGNKDMIERTTTPVDPYLYLHAIHRRAEPISWTLRSNNVIQIDQVTVDNIDF